MYFRIVQQYERAGNLKFLFGVIQRQFLVIFRLGRLKSGGAKGPGLFFIIPVSLLIQYRIFLQKIFLKMPILVHRRVSQN
jgi:regulator of protease activity HflC (stomatin/prohibitin superfamily)